MSYIARNFTQHQIPKLEYLLGLVLAQKHDYAGALEHIRNYLHLSPHSADVETAQKQAEELERLSAKATAGKMTAGRRASFLGRAPAEI